MVMKPSIAKSRLGNGVGVGGSPAGQSQGGESLKTGDSLGPDLSFRGLSQGPRFCGTWILCPRG